MSKPAVVIFVFFHLNVAQTSSSTFFPILICTVRETEKIQITCLHWGLLLVWADSSVCPVCTKAVASTHCCSKVLWSRKRLSWELALRRGEGDTLNSPCLLQKSLEILSPFFSGVLEKTLHLYLPEFSRLGGLCTATARSAETPAALQFLLAFQETQQTQCLQAATRYNCGVGGQRDTPRTGQSLMWPVKTSS